GRAGEAARERGATRCALTVGAHPGPRHAAPVLLRPSHRRRGPVLLPPVAGVGARPAFLWVAGVGAQASTGRGSLDPRHGRPVPRGDPGGGSRWTLSP